MEIIPAIDLMHARVVHAKKGRRSQYKPVHSRLCKRSEPRAVIDALLGVYPFQTLYIADLDALMQKRCNHPLIDDLRRAYPAITFWIDQGLPRDRLPAVQRDRAISVIGSESLSPKTLPLLRDVAAHGHILSLDFFNQRLLGPAVLGEDAGLWPEKIIIMSLACVGGSGGPDFERLGRFSRRWPEAFFIAAGGIRHQQDIERLDRMGIKAVLVASALHSGSLDRDALSGYG